MKRKKKHEEHVDEAWLLPYSDMLTLLLALFIVMFAMAKVDDEKFQEIRSEFGTILSSHHSSSSVIGSVIDMGETNTGKKHPHLRKHKHRKPLYGLNWKINNCKNQRSAITRISFFRPKRSNRSSLRI
ncbi:hypothetical protein ODV97_12945 [Enterococcus gallinarum]|nr:hypothetical protein [Enterococcus gallinarum]